MKQSKFYLPPIQDMLNGILVKEDKRPLNHNLCITTEPTIKLSKLSEQQRHQRSIFLTKYHPYNHQHTSSDPIKNRYACQQCTKTFSRPSSLRVHILSHTGEKPHVCPQPGCGRKFSVQSNMRRHLKVHY